jgi:type IX secretion system PorP/SprF family membrane protein
MRKKIQHIGWVLALLTTCIYNADAQQDAMFTRYTFVNNMQYNPAMAGKYDGWRASVAYRRQWANVTGGPTTVAMGIEKPLMDDRAGIGINLYNDRIGFDQHNGGHINFAYSIKAVQSWAIRLGLKTGVSHVSSDFSQAVTPQPGVDPIHTNPYSRVVARAGLGMLITNNKSYVGLSVPNVLSFLKSEIQIKDNNAYLSRHMYATIGHVFGDESADLQLKPSIFVRYQVAAPLQVDLNAQVWFKNRVAVGLSYRTGDAVSGIVDVAITPEFTLSYAYDHTTSGFRQIGSTAHEFVILYTLKKQTLKIPSIHKFSNMPKI